MLFLAARFEDFSATSLESIAVAEAVSFLTGLLARLRAFFGSGAIKKILFYIKLVWVLLLIISSLQKLSVSRRIYRAESLALSIADDQQIANSA
jgi:hypothetical protein